LRRIDPAEGEIDALAARARLLRHAMHPFLLRASAHHEQAAVRERERVRGVRAGGGGVCVRAGRTSNVRVAPRLTDAITGSGPSSRSLSACQPMLSSPPR